MMPCRLLLMLDAMPLSADAITSMLITRLCLLMLFIAMPLSMRRCYITPLLCHADDYRRYFRAFFIDAMPY